MADIEFTLKRDLRTDEFTLGRLLCGTEHMGYVCEDVDRDLEHHPECKIPGETAIPRGRYRLTATMSQRFGRVMPLIVDVPGYEGVRIHGGNTAVDTEGCPLLGKTRTAVGVLNCPEVNERLLKRIQDEEAAGNHCWITVK
jgi:hypothetical protein